MKITSALGSGLLSTFMLVAMHGDAHAQRRRRVACEEGQHVSGGHCCDHAGEEWVEARNACVCLDGSGCGANAAPAPTPTRTPPVVTQPTPVVTQPTPVVTQPPPPAQNEQLTCPEGMVLVRGTTFMMGSVPGVGDADESPAHRVTLSSYCIDRTEVTVGQYRGCMQAGTCSLHTTVNLPGLSAQDAQMYSQYCNGARTDRDTHPINCVDWSQADVYCHSRSGRLPTEAEWELAARGTDQRLYPWGQPAPARMLLNACDADCQSLFERPGRARGATIHDSTDGFSTTAPVGTFPAGASLFGLHDMAGNVGEWVGDWYAAYPNIPSNDPAGPTSGADRVVRGGHWQSSNPRAVRGAARIHTAPAVRLATVGFRCVATPQAPAAPPPPEATATPEPTEQPEGGRRRRRHGR